MSDKTQILGNWYRRVWEEEDAEAIDKLFVPDSDIRQIGMSKPIDLEEFKGFHKLFCDQLQNIDIHIDNGYRTRRLARRSVLMLRKKSRTGENITITGNVMVKITDGKLRGGYEHWDFMGLWDQLGLLPGESFQKCCKDRSLLKF